MTERESKRLRNFFTYDFTHPCIYKNVLGHLKKVIESYRSWVNFDYVNKHSARIKLIQRAIRIIETNNISNSELLNLINEVNPEKERISLYGRNTPIKPNRKRDSKVDTVYEYYSTCDKIRFPSKKRSRATWKRFYTMFPNLAKEDGWDGKTSKRMK